MLCDKQECTGCGACVVVCPRNCITMEPDEISTLYPVIHTDRCCRCNRCTKICPSLQKPVGSEPKTAYASWSLNLEDRKSSASGGFLSVLSGYVIRQSGVVYGAAWEKGVLQHTRVDSLKQLSGLKGSQYLSSATENAFRNAIEDLAQGKMVLYIGLPCQAAGMRMLAGGAPALVTADLICHGCPPQQYWHEYVRDLGITHCEHVSFRDSRGFYLTVSTGTGQALSGDFDESPYYLAFLKQLTYRACCYQCRYASAARVSDITAGDFWGVGKYGGFAHETAAGVSLVLPATAQGERLLELCRPALFLEERPLQEALDGNEQLRTPSKPHRNRERFERTYRKRGFNKAVKDAMTTELASIPFKKLLKRNERLYAKIRAVLSKASTTQTK